MTLRRVILTILAVVLSTLAPPPPHRHHHRAPPPPPPPPPPHREADVTSRMYYPTPRPKIGESHAGSIDRPDSRCAHATAAAAALACLRRPLPACARARGRRSARTSILQTRISESARERTTQCRAFRRRAARPLPACRRQARFISPHETSPDTCGVNRVATHTRGVATGAPSHMARGSSYMPPTQPPAARAPRGSACFPPALTAGSFACAQARPRRLRRRPVPSSLREAAGG